MQPDPIDVTPERLTDPQQLNPYLYTRGNPLKFVDPDGRNSDLPAAQPGSGGRGGGVYFPSSGKGILDIFGFGGRASPRPVPVPLIPPGIGFAVRGGLMGGALVGGALSGLKVLNHIESPALRGEWEEVSEDMSERAADYQQQITGGVSPDFAYVIDGVKFDGIADDVLLEAKGPGYATFTANGEFQQWFDGAENLVEQAQRQVNAADGQRIVWQVAEAEAAVAIQNLLEDRGISGIEVVHTPPEE